MLLSADPNVDTEMQDQPAVGSVVDGRYKILEVAGRGGMGVVYKAQHLHMSRTVALKMLLKEANADEQANKRFQQEARAVSLLRHPNIVAVYDSGLVNNQAYLAMDFLDGISLYGAIHETNGLSLDRFRHIFRQACDALSHAHKNGVVHRDIKPSNLLLVERDGDKDFLVIVDFGLVKLMSNSDQNLTSTDMLVGSPLYMSPEQCRGLKVDHRTDIYSLGCVMYEALTARPPLAGETPLDTLYQHVARMPLPMTEANPRSNVPPALEKVIFKALSKDHKDRQQSMDQLCEELECALAQPEPGVATIAGSNSQRQASASQASAFIKSAEIIKPRPVAKTVSRSKQKPGASPWLVPVVSVALVALVIIGSLVRIILWQEHTIEKDEQHPPSAQLVKPDVSPPTQPVSKPAAQTAKAKAVTPAYPDSKISAAAKIDNLVKQANKAYLSGNYQLARSTYESCLAQQQKQLGTADAREVPVVAMLIICTQKLGDESSLVQYLNQFSDLYPAYPATIQGDVPLLEDLSEISLVHEDTTLATLLLKNAIASREKKLQAPDKDSLELRMKLARLLKQTKQYDSAVDVLQQVIAQSGRNPLIHRNATALMIDVLNAAGRFNEAAALESPRSQQTPAWQGQSSAWQQMQSRLRNRGRGFFGR